MKTKYRAWDLHNKEMYLPEKLSRLTKITSEGVIQLNPHHREDFWEFMPVHRYVIMQGINKTDMKGTNMYDGDIIRVHIKSHTEHYGKTADFQIKIEEDDWGIHTSWESLRGYECSTHIMRGHDELGGCNYEVIGNIYANPEYLHTNKKTKKVK